MEFLGHSQINTESSSGGDTISRTDDYGSVVPLINTGDGTTADESRMSNSGASRPQSYGSAFEIDELLVNFKFISSKCSLKLGFLAFGIPAHSY